MAAFYDALPFNYASSAAAAARIVRNRNQIANSYPDLDELLHPGLSVLDVGCGPGWLTHTCAYHYEARVVGIDLSTTALSRAREIAAELGIESSAEFRQVDLFRFETAEQFDVVCSLGVLHHTADVPGALAAISRFVGSGGSLYVGLYHAYGRAPFLAHFARCRALAAEGLLSKAELDDALERYAELDTRISDRTLLPSWFHDQVLHPQETQHTLKEIAGILDRIGFTIVSTSVNHFKPIGDLAELFELERDYERRARHAIEVEKRYMPGFFTVLARPNADSRPSTPRA